MLPRIAVLSRRASSLASLLAAAALAGCGSSGGGGSPTPTPQGFSVTDLGTLGGTTSEARWVNNNGQVVGRSTTAAGAQHAFVWQNGAMTDLGTLPGFTGSVATGINDAGQVVGTADHADGTTRAFLAANGSLTDLGTLGGASSRASAINAGGAVVGSAQTASGALHAFIFQNGALTDIGVPPGFTSSEAASVNDAGQVAGRYYTDLATDSHAFVWQSGSLTNLDPLAGYASGQATFVDAAGHVLGASVTDTGQSHAVSWQNGRSFDLDVAPAPTAMNRTGFAVGGTTKALLYANGEWIDLNTKLLPGSGWQLQAATGINDHGQIVGWGLHNGQLRAFLLNPS